MKGRRVVIPVELILERLQSQANSFLKSKGISFDFTENDANDCLLALVKDIISSRSHSDVNHNALDQALVWISDAFCKESLQNDFEFKVLDDIEIQICVFLDNFIPTTTWDMWVVQGIFDDSMYIESYGDYRIWYYHQYVEGSNDGGETNCCLP